MFVTLGLPTQFLRAAQGRGALPRS